MQATILALMLGAGSSLIAPSALPRTKRVGGASIYRVKATEGSEGRVERIGVEVGSTDGDFVEVRGGVQAGDAVVRRGHGGLANGMSVVVRGASQSQVAAGEAAAGNDS